MAIAGLSSFKYTTDWEYETSEDTTGSFFASVSFGKIILKRSSTGEKLAIKYRCVAISLSKGLPIGYAQSQFTDPSGGYGTVCSNKYFDWSCFPCKGYIVSAGNTLGVLDEGAATNGTSWNIFYFGAWPFAGIRCWGNYRASTPGGGVGGGIAGFGLDDD
jgi:hypothetical protein